MTSKAPQPCCSEYAALSRRGLFASAIALAGVSTDQLLAKDAMFGLHPQLAPLLPLWNAGSLAAVHATGLPAPNRSHFAAMEEVEDADPG